MLNTGFKNGVTPLLKAAEADGAVNMFLFPNADLHVQDKVFSLH